MCWLHLLKFFTGLLFNKYPQGGAQNGSLNHARTLQWLVTAREAFKNSFKFYCIGDSYKKAENFWRSSLTGYEKLARLLLVSSLNNPRPFHFQDGHQNFPVDRGISDATIIHRSFLLCLATSIKETQHRFHPGRRFGKNVCMFVFYDALKFNHHVHISLPTFF